MGQPITTFRARPRRKEEASACPYPPFSLFRRWLHLSQPVEKFKSVVPRWKKQFTSVLRSALFVFTVTVFNCWCMSLLLYNLYTSKNNNDMICYDRAKERKMITHFLPKNFDFLANFHSHFVSLFLLAQSCKSQIQLCYPGWNILLCCRHHFSIRNQDRFYMIYLL